MPDIAGKTLFSSGGDISPDDLGNTEVRNFNTSIDTNLRENYAWSGKATAVIGLNLSPDNEKVTNGIFAVRGSLDDAKEIRFKCSHIWPDSSDNTTMLVNFPSANIFKFGEGGLWSDLVPSQNIMHSFHGRDNRMINADEQEKRGIGDFSARMICQVSSTSSDRKGIVIKYMIVLFPGSAADLADSAESRFPGFPGLKVGEGSFPLGPKPSQTWQCPVIPFIIPGAPYEEIAMAPTSHRLRAAIAAIMKKAGMPDTLRNGALVLEKWERLRAHPRDLQDVPPPITWPSTTSLPEEQGKQT